MAPPSTFCSRQKRRRTDGPNSVRKDAARRAGLYHCNYCQADVSGQVRIRCAVCPDFDLCLDCFRVGVEVHGSTPPHLADHAYRVIDNLSFPLFHPAWGADEELLLVEAVDAYGLGNWAAVGEHVATKLPEQCSAHYYAVYVDSHDFPRPAPLPEMEGVDPSDFVHSPLKFQQLQRRWGQQSLTSTAAAQQGGESGAKTAARPASSKSRSAGSTQPVSVPKAPKPSILQEAVLHGSAASAPLASAGSGAAGGEGHGGEEAEVQGAQPAAEPVKKEEAVGEEGGGVTMGPQPAAEPGTAAMATAATAAEPQQRGNKGKRKRADLDAVAGAAHGQSGGGGNAEAKVEGEGDEGAADGATRTPAPGQPSGKTLRQDAMQAPQAIKLGNGLVEVTTFNAKRNEFEHEYDNEAELVVAELEFRPDDTVEEKAGKLRLLEIYNARLDERERRRECVKDKGLLNVKAMQALEKRRSPAEREMHAALRPFASLLAPDKAAALGEGLLSEARLRSRLAELQQYRRAGVRTFAEAEEYDASRKRWAAEQRAALGELGDALDGVLASDPLKQVGMVKAVVESLFGSQHGLETAIGTLRQDGRTGDSRSAGGALAAWRTRHGIGLDITCAPGVEALTGRERELCAALRMLPAHYLLLKRHMMRKAAQGEALSRQQVRRYFRLDPAKALRVFDLLAAAGWIPGANVVKGAGVSGGGTVTASLAEGSGTNAAVTAATAVSDDGTSTALVEGVANGE